MVLREYTRKKAQNKPVTISSYQHCITKKSHLKQSKTTKKSSHSNKEVTVAEWANRLKYHLDKLSIQKQDIIFSYLSPIREGINEATKNDRLHELETFDEKKESFEYALLIKGTTYLLSDRPRNEAVKKWAKKLASKRKYTWKTSLIRQREAVQILPNSYKFIFDDEGCIADIGLISKEWHPPINPPNFLEENPEEYIITSEIYSKIQQLPTALTNLNRIHAKEYSRILNARLNGIDVKPTNGPQLGISQKNVASLNFQMKIAVREILTKYDPDLEKKIAIYESHKGKSSHIEKSTFNERKELYRDPYAGQKIACTLRIWRIKQNNKTRTINPQSSSEIVLNPKTKKFDEIT